jgi:predicted O-linked N-acetylglucosamine transferase (SPINDLY family)
MSVSLSIQNLLEQAITNFQANNFEQSKQLLSILLKLDPKNFNALLLIGVISGIQGKHSDALSFFEKARKLDPNNALVCLNNAKALSELDRDEDAIKLYSLCTCLDENNAEAWLGYGKSLQKMQRYEEALQKYTKATVINDKYPEALANKGLIFSHLNKYEDALECYQKAMQINQHIPEVWQGMGDVYKDLAVFDKALHCYEQALMLNPDINFLFGEYLHVKMRVCDWLNFDDNINICRKKIMQGEKVIAPFQLLSLFDDSQLEKLCAEIYSKDKNLATSHTALKSTRDIFTKIRVGYLSPDFRNHPVSYLMAEVFESHNSNKFETFGIYIGPKTNDFMHERISKAFDHFIDCNDQTDDAIFLSLKKLKLDIIVDLVGHTGKNKLTILAKRPAPIQINYLGYPGTTGAKFIDYIIADKNVIPPKNSENYSEKIIYLPRCFQANDSKRTVPGNTLIRSDFNLPNDSFVFCCFNNTYKLNPTIFDSWSEIINKTTDSILWFTVTDQLTEGNIKRALVNRGVSESRIVFARRCKYDEYLSRYQLADLFLDTLPFNAGTTASDALWSGLPVLTQCGNSFSGRMATSLLTSLGMTELIANSRDEYVSKAINLCQDANQLELIKQKIDTLKVNNSLFDGKEFARQLEQAFEIAFNKNLNGLPPSSFDVV